MLVQSMFTMVEWMFILVSLLALGKAENDLMALTEEGKIQYDIISREAQMPRYGDCYQNTLSDLHKGCSQLSDEVQSRLALSFTNCYLRRFGWSVYPCSDHQILEECMENMDARSASVYSAMLTNTLAMCHFLQAQVWHQSTTDAVQVLISASESVNSQLSQAVDSAASLREQLDSQLLESREAFRSAFTEMRESTAEQRNLIIDVFDRVAQLQALVMGEFTWFYSVVFYVSCVIVSLVVTCTPQTVAARLPLFTTLAASLIVERAVTSLLLADSNRDTLQEDLHAAVWRIRHTCITVCCLVVVKVAVMYRDPVAVTAARLEELASATLEIKKLINSAPEKAIEMSTTTLASLAQIFDESASSDDTYDPTDESMIEDCFFSSNMLVENGTDSERYNFRKRPNTPVPQNPIVAMESPDAFGRIVKRRESLTRRRSSSQLRQFSILGETYPHSNCDEMLPKEPGSAMSL